MVHHIGQIAVALPVIAIVVALVAGVSLSAALAPIADVEFWWGTLFGSPLTAIGRWLASSCGRRGSFPV